MILQQNHPGWTFEFGNEGIHPHPISATERAITEELMYRDIMKTFPNANITDIGGNPNRHVACGRTNIHSCCPTLDGVDAVRRLCYTMHPEAKYCNNKAENCRYRPDVYMSVHSLYYLSRDDILNLLLRSKTSVLYATLHRYDDIYGNDPHGESRYQYVGDGNKLCVSVSVNGNLRPYTHPTMEWLTDSYYDSENSDYAMAWDANQINQTWIFKFIIAKKGMAPSRNPAMTLVTSLNRNDHYGAVQGIASLDDEQSLKPALEVMKLNNKKVQSFGRFMWLSTTTKTEYILIPKTIVQQVALKMVGVSRDKAGLKKCIREMQNAINSSRVSLPIDIKLNCAIYGSSLAFVMHLENEVVSFSRLCLPKHRKLAKALDNVMNFDWMFGLMCCRGMRDPELEPLSVSSYNRDRVSEPCSPYNARKHWPTGLPGYESNKTLKTIRPKATIKNGSTDKQEDRTGQAYPVAIGFSECIPRFPYSSHNNETIGLCNRALMKVPKPDPNAWTELIESTDFNVVDFSCWPSTESDWFDEWNENYPRNQQKRHNTAKELLDRDGLLPADFQRKAFAKREASIKGVENVVDFDPRIIQAATDKYNVALGPWMRVFGKLLAKSWNKNERICYTSGLTGEDLGMWRAQFQEDDVTIIEIDHSRYDAHQGKESIEFEKKFYAAAGAGDYPDVWTALGGGSVTSGYSMHGAKYRVNYTRRSGDANTSCGNSIVNGTTADYVLRKALSLIGKQHLHKHMRMVVLGDDNLIVLPGTMTSDTQSLLRREMMSAYLSLGYEITMKVHTEWHDAEFCSSLFWPVRDGFILGPKIGRRLPKLGWSLSDLKPGEIKGMLLGAHNELHCIPVLRHYAPKCLNYLKYTKKRDHNPKEAKYKTTIVEKHQMTDDTKAFFYERYGLSCDEVEEEFKTALNNATSLTTVVSFSRLIDLMLIDVGEE